MSIAVVRSLVSATILHCCTLHFLLSLRFWCTLGYYGHLGWGSGTLGQTPEEKAVVDG
jgi:hypothetical protein